MQVISSNVVGQSLDTYSILINLAAGVCLLLWGSYTVRSAVERVFSNTISGLLSTSGSSTLRSIIIGLFAAVFLQSATATVLIATGLLNAGVMTVYATLGIVLGADLGSAIAARILFLDFSLLPSIFIVTGMVTFLASQRTRLKTLGKIAIGIGIMLLSLQLIKAAIKPITAGSISNTWVLIFQSAPWVAVIIIALATWFAHSSVATVLVIALFAKTGVFGPEVFIPMVIGVNIGAGLISIPLIEKKNLESRSVVFANLAIRALLGLALLLSIDLWLDKIPFDKVDAGGLVIICHLLFNAILVIVASPFIRPIANYATKALSPKGQDVAQSLLISAGSGLQQSDIDKPDLAISNAKREAFRLGDITEGYLKKSLAMFAANDESQIDAIVALDDEINRRNRALHAYLSRVRTSVTDPTQEATLDNILHFSSSMENIGDIISHGFSRLAKKRLYRGVNFSKKGEKEITAAHQELLKLLRLVINQFAEGHDEYKHQINTIAHQVKQHCANSMTNHRQRLSNQKSRSISSSSIHQDILRDLLTITFLLETYLGSQLVEKNNG